MSLSEEIRKINAEINKLRKEMGDKPLKPFKQEDLEAAKLALAGINAEIRELSTDLDYVSKSFKDSVNELSKQNTYLSDARSSLKGIASISDKILEYRKGEITLSEKQLKTLQQQAKAKFDSLQNDIRSGLLGKENTKEAQDALDKRVLFNSEIERTIQHQKAVNKEIGLLGTGLDGAAKILSKMGFGDLSKPLQDAIDKTKNARLQQKLNNDELKKVKKEYDKLGLHDLEKKKALRDQMASLKSQNKSLDSQTSKYKNIGKALKDQLTSANLLAYVYKSLIEAFGTSQKGIGDLAKGLGMSASRATVMRQEFANIANSSMNANLTAKAMQDTQLAVGQALGTNAKLNIEDNKTMTEIVKKTGLQHSELIGIEKLSLATGKSLDDNVKSALGGAKAFASQNKLAVDNNRVLREVNKASSALKLSLGGSVEELGKAVMQAQKFGINLEQAESMASKLLDFESSIEAELSAELLTGKNLNLEKARGLALEGKSVDAATEMLKQIGGSAEFIKMNVINQEALANAVGMTRQGLADSLIEREALAAMGGKEEETALARYNQLVKEGKTREEILDMVGEDALLNLEQQSAQDKFNNSIIKLKEIFVQVMDALAPIFDVLASIAEVVLPALNFILRPIVTAFTGMGKILTLSFDTLTGWQWVLGGILTIWAGISAYTKLNAMRVAGIAALEGTIALHKKAQNMLDLRGLSLGKSKLVQLAAQAALWALANPIKALTLGIAAGVAIYAATKTYMKDGVIGPGGETIVSGPKGSIQLDKEDSMIVGTDLGGKKKPKPQGGGGGGASVDLTQTNALLQQLINTNLQVIKVIQTGGIITLDGQKVGTALKLGSFKTQ
jgi:hypothetical protein